jgi:hypothetical protein
MGPRQGYRFSVGAPLKSCAGEVRAASVGLKCGLKGKEAIASNKIVKSKAVKD